VDVLLLLAHPCSLDKRPLNRLLYDILTCLFLNIFLQFQLSYPELYSSRSLELSNKLAELRIAEARQPLLKRSLTKLRNIRL